MKVYVAMPINAADYDHERMFARVGELVRGYGLEPILPNDDISPEVWESLLEQTYFSEACDRVVSSDLANLRESDAILAIMPHASIGTAMEICYAAQWNKIVVVVVSLKTLYHPWIRYHANKVVWSEDPFGEGVRRACLWLSRLPTNRPSE